MRKTAGNSATAGTATSAREQSPTRRLCLAMAQELETDDIEATRIVSALQEVLRREGWRIHANVPVCTHCREAVDKLAWDALERLDTLHAPSAQVMLQQAREDAASFRAELEGRGVKI